VKAIKIGHWEFDHVEYDADGDVLYLSIGEPRPSYGRETPEGHVQLFDQETDAFCGGRAGPLRRACVVYERARG
jgi:hypothetical protein